MISAQLDKVMSKWSLRNSLEGLILNIILNPHTIFRRMKRAPTQPMKANIFGALTRLSSSQRKKEATQIHFNNRPDKKTISSGRTRRGNKRRVGSPTSSVADRFAQTQNTRLQVSQNSRPFSAIVPTHKEPIKWRERHRYSTKINLKFDDSFKFKSVQPNSKEQILWTNLNC